MFGNIRLIIGCVFFVCAILVIGKSKIINKRRLNIVSFIVACILVSVLNFVPFENLFVTFDSPEKVYEYINTDKSDIKLIVEGAESDFIVGSKEDYNLHLIVPKTKDGWKIDVPSNIKNVFFGSYDGITINIYQYKNTIDYYINIHSSEGGEAEITDIYNTEFYSFSEHNDYTDKTYVTYYGHVKDFNMDYSIVVNGDEVRIKDINHAIINK